MRVLLEAFADHAIRRACVGAGAVALSVMAALAFDPVLALRTGAEIAAFLVLGLALAAWRAPARSVRAAGLDSALREAGLPRRRLASALARDALPVVLRERLLWHAERVAVAAVALWGAALAAWMVG